ncbi:ankyrin repeat-containing protein At5g02620-like isoform X1 [Quercus robur]|uniref:ankyrin repeat-containing protein At5g02620-like isoform X1 n=1 Tax=Quercus robur TaxID=38942 RepID=UPI0021636ACD|nr:ankyrin repeat-containing protein At5g02620-like isoform X1 [Quercus robur]
MDAGMFKAAIDGNDGFFDEAGGVNLNLRRVTVEGNSVLHLAGKSGNAQITKRILAIDSQQSLLYEKNWKGDTALHIAARLGHFDMTKLLITSANDREVEVKMELLRMENLEKNTALHEAIKNDHYDIMQLLIKEDPSLTFLTNNAGESPLFLAVDRGFYKIAIHILEAVPECSNVGRKSMNVLHAAVIRTQRSKRFKAIEEKADWHSHTLLCIYRFLRAILKLSNSENEQAPKRGMTILDFVGKLLEACPSAIVEADDFGWIPLHYAAHFGNAKFVNLFLKKNMSLVYIKEKAGMSALHISSKEGHVDVTRTLITECPDSCELLDKKDRTALHLAAESGNSKLVKVFLQTLATEDLINQQDKEGNTPFHLAAMEGRYALLMMFAKDRRIDWMAMNKAGMSTVDIIQSDKRLKSGKKEKFMSKLNRDGIRLSLERIVDRHTMEVQTLDTEAHGQLIQETERNEPVEQNKVKDTALIATKKRLKRQEAIRKMIDLNFVVATIIASVTYAAVIQVPGGNDDDDGEATLRENKYFKIFMIFNACAFVFSLLSMLFHFCIGHVSLSSSIGLIYASLCFTFTQFSLLGITGAFFLSIRAVLTKTSASKSGSGGPPVPGPPPPPGSGGPKVIPMSDPVHSQSSDSNVFTEYWIGLLFVILIFAAVFIRMNKKLVVSILKES